MDSFEDKENSDHIKNEFYKLMVSQLLFDAHSTIAEELRATCCLSNDLCHASADLLHMIYPALLNKSEAGVQCDILDSASSVQEPICNRSELVAESDEHLAKLYLVSSTQTSPGNNCEESNGVPLNNDVISKRKRGRPKKSEQNLIPQSRSRRKTSPKVKKEEADLKHSETLNSPENKRKQRKPQKVLSPDRDKGKAKTKDEAEISEPVDESKLDMDEQIAWDDDYQVFKVPKKRGRKPRIKKEVSKEISTNESFAKGRPHGKRHTTCYGCDMTFTKSADCHNHVLSHFIETETHKICKICDKTLAKSTMHQDHLKVHSSISSFLCNICGATFNRKSSYDNHMEKHSKKKLYCEKCGNGPYNTVKQYERHLTVFHGGQIMKKWMCDVCGKGFYQKNKLDSHVRIHTGERPYTCSFCSATFRCKPHVQRHEEQHKGKKRFTCGVCNHATFQRSNMKVHMRVHSSVSYAETKLFVCALCRSCFHALELFENHKATKHPNYEQDMDTLTDTIGIGKIKMLINPPNRIPSKPDGATDSNQSNKTKRGPRMKFKQETPLVTIQGTSDNIAANSLVQQINSLSNEQTQITTIQGQPPASQVQPRELAPANITNAAVVNNYTVPTSSLQPVLYSTVSHPPLQSVSSAGVPMDYTVATDYSMLMQSVAAAANAGSANSSSNVHPSFLQQHHNFNTLH